MVYCLETVPQEKCLEVYVQYSTYHMYLHRKGWTNNVDPDQTSYNLASEQVSLHCLHPLGKVKV